MRRLAIVLVLAAAGSVSAAPALITLENPSGKARAGEVIAVSFDELVETMPEARMFHMLVRNAATGAVVPHQVTNFEHDHRGFDYDDLVFQHDFAAGETVARFRVEASEAPVPPYRPRVFARYVPERLDDFAWENDRIGYRAYGPVLETPAAGPERLSGSGIDVWAKRVPYLVIDRWYLKCHDQFHRDTGEGLDIYRVGTTRGCGGTGIWDGSALHVSGNWTSWKVLANGPLRAVFELTYGPWTAGDQTVRETRRFTVDAGRNLHRVDCAYQIDGGDGSATAAVGLAIPAGATAADATRAADQRSLSVWNTYPESGGLGCGIVLDPQTAPGGFAEDKGNVLVLVPVRSGETITFYAGAGWDRSGHFASRADWEAYLVGFAERLASPVSARIEPAPAAP